MKKIFVKVSNATNGVKEIVWVDSKEITTPPELKPTLNMFRGQQFPKCFRKLLEYASVSLRAQNGEKEAIEALSNLHKSYNEKD